MNSLQSLLSKFDKRWLGAGAAAAGAMAASQASEAAVVWSGVVNINIPSTTAGVYLNAVTGVFGTAAGTPGWDVNPWSSAGLGLFSPAAPAGGVYVVTAAGFGANLAPGAPIGPANTYGSGSSANNAQWNLNSDQNCIGFRFQNEQNGNQIHYGTMRVSLGATAGGQPRSIVSYAYESVAGQPIAACAPEPSSLALLALGAVGLIRRRK